jgi:uncharacterized membrane protein YhhN
MTWIAIIAPAALLLTLLLVFEHAKKRWHALPVKTLLSVLFVVAVLLQANPPPGYFLWLLIGLILCLVGDVCLALPGQKFFMAGLVSFLAGHVFYVIAFFGISSPGIWTVGSAVATVVVSSVVFLYLRPHLGDMLVPVLAYVVVITVMVVGAFTLMGAPIYRLEGRIAVAAGAVCFYFSDLFVARDKFIGDAFVNRLVGLPLYYGGQFLLAFSAGMLLSSP